VKTPAILQAFKNDLLPAGAQLLQADDPVEIGGHRLTGRLRSSGTGDVYLARDRGAGLVAIKTTHAGTTEPGPLRARLRAEAACSRRLPSSCTARLLRDGTDQTPPFLISEHVEGPSLERVIDVKGPLPAVMVTALATDLAQTLEAIHDEKIVHGNLTPANVLLTKDGLRVIDFGVAQEISASGEPAEIGAVADNPAWLAPELLTGGLPEAACDIFGWGCLVTYAATGHTPFGETGSGRPALGTGALAGPLRRLVDASVGEDPAGRPGATELTARLAEPAGPIPADDTDEPHAAPPVRRPRGIRTRAAVLALAALIGTLVAVPTATEHSPAPPPAARAPSSPPKKPAPKSNTAAMSLQGAPPAPAPAPKAPSRQQIQPRSRRSGTIWMSCGGWCAVPDAKPTTKHPRPPSWRITWMPGG
jgi:eukaryotic-like serine/threonine-protein kinase